MSQATEEKPQLLIDLTNARHATALDASSILHRMQIESFLERVSEVVGRVEGFSEKLKQCGDGRTRSVSYERYHDVITLHGKRGSGKTTFLLSALELLQNSAKRRSAFPERFKKDNNDDGLNGLCVLEILDPTLFGLHEHLLLSLMAKIAFEVRCAVKNSERNLCGGHNGHCKLEEWENRLRQFAKALKHMGETRDDLDTPLSKEKVEWEDSQFIFEQNMENAQRSFGLEREFHKFLHDSLKLIDKKAFVLALDDIDTRPQIGWHVLEVLRRYFTSPQLVVVLSGDMDLFKTIIEKQQLKIFDLNFASSTDVRKEFKTRVDGLTEQYLLKILRTPSRINLGSFATALLQWGRRYPDSTLAVASHGIEVSIRDLLQERYFKFLACHSSFEQQLFLRALFLNPARTVTQVFDALLGHGHEAFVERMREIFLVSLQNLGFERPFDLAEALYAPQGINIIVEQLFKRGYVSYGLELLPTRQSQDENNGLLALHAEIGFALQNRTAVFFAFVLKACLLREVLLLQNIEIGTVIYEKLEKYLGLEIQEQPSVTTARVVALHWGESQSANILRAVGLVRLYSKSIVKDMRSVVNVMYGRNVSTLQKAKASCAEPLSVFCNAVCAIDTYKDRPVSVLVNTPETLRSNIRSWQREFLGLGFVDVRLKNETNRLFSVFSLLSVMNDIVESDVTDIPRVFRKYGEVIEVNAFNQSSGLAALKDEYGDDGEDILQREAFEGAEDNKNLNIFIDSIKSWIDGCRVMHKCSDSVTLCARVMTRYFDALKKIHTSDRRTQQSTYIGEYIHRCIVAFFNSILVEEFLLCAKPTKNDSEASPRVSFVHPTNEDNVFLKNLLSSHVLTKSVFAPEPGKPKSILGARAFWINFEGIGLSVDCISDDFPFFRTVFTCPLWSLYLKPDDDLNDDSANTVYGIYMRLLGVDKEKGKAMSAVEYGTDHANFDNLYYIFNSLAVLKSEQAGEKNKNAHKGTQQKQVLETRSDEGKGLKLPLDPPSLKRKSLINNPILKESLLKWTEIYGDEMPEEFLKTYENIVVYYYRNDAVVRRLSDVNYARDFWAYIKKNFKS